MINILHIPTPHALAWWRVIRPDGTIRMISPGERDVMLRKLRAKRVEGQTGDKGGAA